MTSSHVISPLRTAYIALAALGIVFGDIGTSPMYAVAECMRVDGVSSSADSVLGVTSMILWSLLLVVTVKYLLFITRADNHGEGGIFAILALLRSSGRMAPGMGVLATGIALLAAALLLADSMITPALSVMSAVDGLASMRLSHVEGREAVLQYRPRFIADDLLTLKLAVLGGTGMCWLPDWSTPVGVVHAVFPSRRGLTPAVRSFLDFLGETVPVCGSLLRLPAAARAESPPYNAHSLPRP
jgi:hypothetical protein